MNWYKVAKLNKIATMSIFIMRYERDDTCDNLMNLSATLNHLLFTSWMSKQDLGYFREFHNIPSDETITPDGNDFDNIVGIINFYTEAIPKDKIKLFTDHIIAFLRSKGIVTKAPINDTSKTFGSPVVRITVFTNHKAEELINNPNLIPPDINISNGNAYFIFREVLQVSDFKEGYVFKADDLKKRIEYFEQETKLKEGEFAGQNGIMMDFNAFKDPDILNGKKALSTYDEQRVRERLAQIKSIAQWAIDHGFDELVVG